MMGDRVDRVVVSERPIKVHAWSKERRMMRLCTDSQPHSCWKEWWLLQSI